ncbi:Med5-domain-containing protein [Myriangium duriaei CBS 260.36]|uniref:Mediator of RNA polymerase II transcription subunit 5 n=1 Tax=Myriangium duriaei CBS 260.36 TaxID=1168546 RepID=A0A9P4IVU1_9PEZI|nr:Med5-domain-containing protein [Myriangium duriaei CBS 260.36]
MARSLDGSDVNAAQQWTGALHACFTRRLTPDAVDDALAQCFKDSPISGHELAALVLKCGGQSDADCDPLLPAFLNHFFQVNYIDPADLLDALLQVSPYRTQSSPDGTEVQAPTIAQAVQDNAFALLPGLYASGDRPRNAAEATKTFRILLNWVQAYNAFETMQQINAGGIHTPDSAMVSSYENLGAFLVMLLSSVTVKKYLTSAIPKGAKPKMVSTISHFATTLAQWSQSQISQALQFALKVPPFVSQGNAGLPDFSPAEIAAEVIDVPRSTSRSGLYIYVNAALCGRPRVNDNHLLSFLQVRYPSDPQSMISDLVVAAFDALVNVLQRHETTHLVLCHRSFIANKVPLLITNLSSKHLYPTSLVEQYIQLAMGRIETHMFPPLSSDTAGINEAVRDSRQDFLRVCQVHHLISEAAVTASLGQTPTKPTPTTRHHRHILIQQLLASPQKSEELVGELDRMTGDVGSISNALVDALQQASVTKETMTVKVICNALCRKLPFVDIMLQHVHLNDILRPLGTFLNEWTQDEDQSELQPAYEDFATILLFTLAVVHRYDVTTAELDEFAADSFIIKIQAQKSRSRHMSDLSEEQKNILSNWTKGLFAVDEKGESTGIRDETMSGCSPQTFYLLVPTLFEQIVLACRLKALVSNTLKGGLEFLLEPFLLPSLIGGMGWLANHVWATQKDTDIVLQILQKLIKPASISGDAQMMHQTILGIMYKDLRHCLLDIDRRTPNRKDVSQLQAALKQYADSQYESEGTVSEVKEWAGPFPNLDQAVSNLVNHLTTWSTQSEINPVPPNYTHRMIDAAVSRCGTDEILDCLVNEVTSQTAVGFGSSGLEVATCLICAPHIWQNNGQTISVERPLGGKVSQQMTLSEVLKIKLSDVNFLMKQEQSKAETLIRLGRLVDSQSVLLDMPFPGSLNIPTGDLMEGIDAADAAAVANTAMDSVDQAALNAATADFAASMEQGIDLSGAGADLSMGDGTGLNIDLSDHLFTGDGDATFDLGLDATMTGAQGTQQQNNDDDIFAGIDLGIMGDDDFTF